MATRASVAWAPIVVQSGASALLIRQATADDVATLARWDRDPAVIACATDDPHAVQAFEGAIWAQEIASDSEVSRHYIAELDGRPIGAMQVIDPHLEPMRYWGEIEANLRAIDIWIGEATDRNRGHGSAMMGAVIGRCFSEPSVVAIVNDPLASNTQAHRFYSRLGFKVVGPRRFDRDDCLVHRLDRADWRQGNRQCQKF